MHRWYTAQRGLWLSLSLLLACTSGNAPSEGSAAEASALRRCGEGVVGVGAVGAVWGRDPASGSCNAYDSECAVPADWATFESEEECQTSCRCQSYEFPKGIDPGAPESVWQRTEVISLACECSIFGCDRADDQLATIGSAWCARYGQPRVIRKQGCGQIAFELDSGYIGGRAVFDAESGELSGRFSYGDVPGGPCGTAARRAGQDFRCDSAETCLLCGAWTETSPAPPPCE